MVFVKVRGDFMVVNFHFRMNGRLELCYIAHLLIVEFLVFVLLRNDDLWQGALLDRFSASYNGLWTLVFYFSLKELRHGVAHA